MIAELVMLQVAGCWECVPPPEPPNCLWSHVQDQGAVIGLSQLPQKQPWEVGFAIRCDVPYATYVTLTDYVDSWQTTNDPCGLAYMGPVALAYAHTHPWFDTASEYRAGNGCLGDQSSPTPQQLNVLNTTTQTRFSDNDRNFVSVNNKPLYLRIPSGTQYKVRRAGGAEQVL